MSNHSDKLKVLFVCLGNICRSPLAEGVFKHLVEREGLGGRFEIDSAGTSAYHAGDPPDPRTIAVARERGITVCGESRPVTGGDLEEYDYVVVMDAENEARVRRLAQGSAIRARIHRLREFDALANGELNVPDPYYGGSRGFEDVHDIIERSCAGLLAHIRTEHPL